MQKMQKIAIVKRHLNKMGIDSEGLDFSNSVHRYYLYRDVERYGCFSSDSFFASKNQINQYLRDTLFVAEGAEFDNFCIIDCHNDKIVKPRI